jgi:hypothetical protein
MGVTAIVHNGHSGISCHEIASSATSACFREKSTKSIHPERVRDGARPRAITPSGASGDRLIAA